MGQRIFICSRFSADTDEEIADNVQIATRLCRLAYKMGFAPFAPHLLYPQFLEEGKENERADGISMGLEFMAVCAGVWWYSPDEPPSRGMQQELDMAKTLGVPTMEIKEGELL